MRGIKAAAMNDEYQANEPGSDLELARAASRGDRDARRRLVLRLMDRIGMTVRCLAAGDPNTDDYVQDVIIQVLKSIGSFRGESTIESWAERLTIKGSSKSGSTPVKSRQ
ncbi:MAG: hypothetical protein GY854_02530 [Deltaproteobacteria bacterium]|nr:hypothetical protein [Deltaproteobacteria bacterium]